MKLTILGGGGFRVPLVYRALLEDEREPRVDEVALYDRSPERLAVITAVLEQMAGGPRAPVKVVTATEPEPALENADFVFSAIRVGGLRGRVLDERIALDLGVLGQETTGPGGIAYGLRTIPVMLELAERIAAIAPRAFVINFTNPAGMVTEALRTVLGPRVIGICDTPGELSRHAAEALGVPSERVRADYIGLNHLGWLRGLLVDGRNRLPDLLADEAALATLDEAALFGTEWIRTLGAIPNEYLYYFYRNKEAVQAIREQAVTRGAFLERQQEAFYAEASRDRTRAWELWRRAIAEREALYMAEAKGGRPAAEAANGEADSARSSGGYEAVALAVMAAIARDERATMIVNTANQGTVPALPADAVIEVPCLLDAHGAHPLAAPSPDLHQLGLMQQVKAVEQAVIEAATSGSPDAALRAFALHPLVGSLSIARELLAGYRSAIPEVARVFERPAGRSARP